MKHALHVRPVCLQCRASLRRPLKVLESAPTVGISTVTIRGTGVSTSGVSMWTHPTVTSHLVSPDAPHADTYTSHQTQHDSLLRGGSSVFLELHCILSPRSVCWIREVEAKVEEHAQRPRHAHAVHQAVPQCRSIARVSHCISSHLHTPSGCRTLSLCDRVDVGFSLCVIAEKASRHCIGYVPFSTSLRPQT